MEYDQLIALHWGLFSQGSRRRSLNINGVYSQNTIIDTDKI